MGWRPLLPDDALEAIHGLGHEEALTGFVIHPYGHILNDDKLSIEFDALGNRPLTSCCLD